MTRSCRRQSNSVVLHPMWVDGDNNSNFSLLIHSNTSYLSVGSGTSSTQESKSHPSPKAQKLCHSSMRYESILFHMRWDQGRSQDFHILDEWSGLGISNNSVGLREMNNFHLSPSPASMGRDWLHQTSSTRGPLPMSAMQVVFCCLEHFNVLHFSPCDIWNSLDYSELCQVCWGCESQLLPYFGTLIAI